jgi:hypothetical protein
MGPPRSGFGSTEGRGGGFVLGSMHSTLGSGRQASVVNVQAIVSARRIKTTARYGKAFDQRNAGLSIPRS